MNFTLVFKDIGETREIPYENFTINDLIKELELSSQTIVSK